MIIQSSIGVLVALSLILTGCDEAPKTQPAPAPAKPIGTSAPAPAKPADGAKPAADPAKITSPDQLMKGIEYNPAGKRDPFISLAKRPEAQKKTGIGSLENFDAGELQLIAILWEKGTGFAVLTAPNGKSFTVRQGMKVGLHGGQVAKIAQDSITIREVVRNYKGVLAPKDTVLKLRRGDDQ